MIDFLNNIRFATAGVFEYFTFKSFFSLIITGGVFMVGADQLSAINMLLLLVVIDFITGLASAKAKGDVITSRKASRSAIKVVVYLLLIASAHLAEVIIPGDSFFETVVISFLALTEFISILENIGKMGYAIPLKLLNKLQELRDAK